MKVYSMIVTIKKPCLKNAMQSAVSSACRQKVNERGWNIGVQKGWEKGTTVFSKRKKKTWQLFIIHIT